MYSCVIFAFLASAVVAMPLPDMHGEQLYAANGKLDAILEKLDAIEAQISCHHENDVRKCFFFFACYLKL